MQAYQNALKTNPHKFRSAKEYLKHCQATTEDDKRLVLMTAYQWLQHHPENLTEILSMSPELAQKMYDLLSQARTPGLATDLAAKYICVAVIKFFEAYRFWIENRPVPDLEDHDDEEYEMVEELIL